MKPNLTKLAGVLLLLCAALPAHTLGSVSLKLGRGNNTGMGRVGMHWDWNKSWAVGDRFGNLLAWVGDLANRANTIWVIACNTCQIPVPANPTTVSTSTRFGFPIILMRHLNK